MMINLVYKYDRVLYVKIKWVLVFCRGGNLGIFIIYGNIVVFVLCIYNL